MKNALAHMLADSPVIAAVKSEAQLEACLRSPCRVVFLLFGDICGLPALVARAKAGGRAALVHVDLIGGLAPKEVAMDFIAQNTAADGIVSTRPNLIRRARELGLVTVLRVFAIDSMAVESLKRERQLAGPDLIEVMPGAIPKVIRRIRDSVDTPLIAGGLLTDKEDALNALGAGALAISTSCEALWRA